MPVGSAGGAGTAGPADPSARLRAEGGSALRGAGQLSELNRCAGRVPYEEVYSDFDAICPKNWERKGVTGRSGSLRLAQGAAVHRQLPRADARLLRAGR